MAKTIQYDRKMVIEKAMDLYWEKGFHATSMRNLQDVVDMRPGSIYAGFGSKEGLFSEALDHYAQLSSDKIKACIHEGGSPLQALKLFIKNAVVNSHQSSPSGMCMLVKTVTELTGSNSELLVKARSLLEQIEGVFAQVVEAAQEKGEIDASQDSARIAQYLQIQLMGLRTYYRSKDGQAPIDELVDDVFMNGPFRR